MIEQTSRIENETNSLAKALLKKTKIPCIILYGWAKSLSIKVLTLLQELCIQIHIMEIVFINMSNIFAFICQLLFLTMCEMVLLEESQIITKNDNDDLIIHQGIVSVSALLFYNVFGYFVAKIKDICLHDWTHSRVNHYSSTLYVKWAIRIILEWAKAIAVVLCIKDKGITYQPDLVYTTLTFLYYICTEKLFIDLFISLASYLKLKIFDCMEHMYIPIILDMYVILCAIGVTLCKSSHEQVMYTLFASYFVLYLRVKDLYYNYIKALLLENKTYASFRHATNNDIQEWDDICAVCLNQMNKAMVTPCNHLFHPSCLKQCLRTSLKCPLCKYNFIQ